MIKNLPGFEPLFQKLLHLDMQIQLPGLPLGGPPAEGLSDAEIRLLLCAASALSLDLDEKSRRTSYEVASRLVEMFGRQREYVVIAADMILSRIGNFPGRKFLRKHYGSHTGGVAKMPIRLSVERFAREFENTIDSTVSAGGPLTDFQCDLFAKLRVKKAISISAPTSSGKSFVLGLELARRIKEGRESVIYLVPTRALIREVSARIRNLLREAELGPVPVRVISFPMSRAEAVNGVVYVLTQERLMSLLSADESEAWVDTLIVDEAHNIQDASRGVILQAAIERVLHRFPATSVIFAAPLSSNPELLLELIGKDPSGATLIETLSPVSQNVLLVEPQRGKPKTAKFSLLTPTGGISLGVRDIGFDLRGNKGVQRARLARAITRDDEATIIFANDAHTAEQVAIQLCNEGVGLSAMTAGIEELIDYIEKEIHPRYPLIRCLASGVAFHYGDMPALVRARVEDLFKAGDIRFLCCTSTLLQGVNLPARHIIIENPRRGKSGPMPRRDFLNLAGRAGRLLHEFHGNVWCLNPAAWDDPVFQGPPLTQISSAVDNAMMDGGKVIHASFIEETSSKLKEYGDAVLGKIYLDFLNSDRGFNASKWQTKENSELLSETAKLIEEMVVTLPISLLEANAGLRPDRLQALYEFFRSAEDIEAMIPLGPWIKGYYSQMELIIRTLGLIFMDRDDNSYKFFAWLAGQWIHGVPLARILVGRIESDDDEAAVSFKIRSLLKALETEIRFRLVKQYMAYGSVLKYFLMERGDEALANRIEPFHIYLECGASRNSTLNLIALGLSRSTAIAIDSASASLGSARSPEECLQQLSALKEIEIPDLCRRELQELLGS